MSFDPKVYLAKKKGGFDSQAYLAKKAEQPGMLESFFRTMDSYTGAPARAGLNAVLDGREPFSPTLAQIGEDPDQVPTARDLAQKMGLSNKSILPEDVEVPVTFGLVPEIDAVHTRIARASPEDIGTVGIAMGADLTNLIPVVGQAGKLMNVGAKGLKAATAAEKAAVAARGAEGAIDTARGLNLARKKPHSAMIEAAAKELNAPVLPGQVLDSSLMQNLESILQNSPTFIGQKQRELADQGLDAARNAMSSGLKNDNLFSEAELGNQLKNSFAEKISAENAPISELYNKIQESQSAIPLSDRSTSAIARNVGKIKEARISPSSSVAGIVKRVQAELPNLKTVDDIKSYRTLLRKEMAGASQADRAAILNIDARLKALEEGTVVRTGKALAKDTRDPVFAQEAKKLIGERKSANAAYSQLMGKVERLGGKLGIKSPEGPKGFLNKLDDLTPEKVARKLFDKNDSEFLQDMHSLFPDEVGAIFDFEKAKILANATKDQKVNPLQVLSEMEKLSPEAQRLMFTPEQLRKFGASKTYLESLPASANPSRTAFTQDLLTFTDKPIRATMANARDAAFRKVLSSASAGDGTTADLFTKVGGGVTNAGRAAARGAETSRKSLRLAALERVDDSPRKSAKGLSRRNRIRKKALGE